MAIAVAIDISRVRQAAAGEERAARDDDGDAGYCHPRLSAAPYHRTQDGGDGGIRRGEVVLRLPRPLQVWDLDVSSSRRVASLPRWPCDSGAVPL